jgi:VHL beta domain
VKARGETARDDDEKENEMTERPKTDVTLKPSAHAAGLAPGWRAGADMLRRWLGRQGVFVGLMAMLIAAGAESASPPLPSLPAQSADQEKALKSLSSSQSTFVHFVNHSSKPVDVYWLNYGGLRVIYRRLRPTQSYDQQTYVTHPWVVTTQYGDGLAIFQPIPLRAQAVITDDMKPSLNYPETPSGQASGGNARK